MQRRFFFSYRALLQQGLKKKPLSAEIISVISSRRGREALQVESHMEVYT